MEEIPAVWNVAPGADDEKVQDVLERLSVNLGIEKPEVKNGAVLLPADYPAVARALDQVEPDWRGETLFTPPEP